MGVPIEENNCLFSLNYSDEVIIAQDADNLEFILKGHVKKRLNNLFKKKIIYSYQQKQKISHKHFYAYEFQSLVDASSAGLIYLYFPPSSQLLYFSVLY